MSAKQHQGETRLDQEQKRMDDADLCDAITKWGEAMDAWQAACKAEDEAKRMLRAAGLKTQRAWEQVGLLLRRVKRLRGQDVD